MTLYHIEETGYLTLTEITERSGATREIVMTMVQYDIIHPKGQAPDDWEFSFKALSRLQKALRLQRDLDLNLSGVAMTLELVEELDRLKAEVARLEHFIELHQ